MAYDSVVKSKFENPLFFKFLLTKFAKRNGILIQCLDSRKCLFKHLLGEIEYIFFNNGRAFHKHLKCFNLVISFWKSLNKKLINCFRKSRFNYQNEEKLHETKWKNN